MPWLAWVFKATFGTLLQFEIITDIKLVNTL